MVRIAIVLSVFWTVINGKLVDLPKNVYVFTGETARMNCSTDADQAPADWRIRRHGSNPIDPIYESGFFQSSFRMRHTLIKGNGSYDLVISNVRPEDAGTYFCIDLAGMGGRAQAELIVIESNPSCESNITSTEGVLVDNSCHLNPDYMEYKCRVKYRGNVPPVMEWRDMEMLTSINMTTIQIVSENRSNELFAINTFVVKSTRDLNGTYFVCHILDVGPANEGNKTCTTPVTNILYAVNSSKELKTVGNEKKHIQCSIETNIRNCNLFWRASTPKKEVLYLEQSSIYFNQSVNDENAMNYECLGECKISGQICTIRGILIKLIPDELQNVSSVFMPELHTIILLILLCVSGAIIVSLLICILKFLKKRSNGIVTVATKCICCAVTERYEERKSKSRIAAFDVGFQSKFKRDVEFLGDVFDAENGLISCLLNNGLLTPVEMSEICKSPSWETNEALRLKLLKYLPSKFKSDPNNIKLFLKALKETKQQHVAKYLTNEAEGDCRPMTDDELLLIDTHLPTLTQFIEADKNFLRQLKTKGCITKTHMRKIRECDTNIERNTKLLTILKRRSYGNFLDFKECLKQTKQGGMNVLLDKKAFEDTQNMCYTPDEKFHASPDKTACPRNRIDVFCSKDVGVQNQTECYDVDDTLTESSKLMPTEPDQSSRKIDKTSSTESDQPTDIIENYCIEKPQESLADKLVDVAAQPILKSAPQQNVDGINIQGGHSSSRDSNSETTKCPTIIEDKGDDEVLSKGSKNQKRSSKVDRQMSVDNKDNNSEESKKTKQYVVIIADSKVSYPSSSSEQPESDARISHSEFDAPKPKPVPNSDVVREFINKIYKANQQHCSLVETRKELDEILESSFVGVGEHAATVVFVITGSGSRDGLTLLKDEPYKLDNILRKISELHSNSLKKGHLPNHVTVMFVCSYGHCYTEKKYSNAMDVIKYTDRKKTEIEPNLCKFVLSTILPKTDPKPLAESKRKRILSSQSYGGHTSGF